MKLLDLRAATLVVVLSFGVATVGCYWLSSRFDPMITCESTESSYFEADIPRVFRNMTDRSSDHYRSKVHPIFSLAAYAPVKLISGVLGIGDREAVNAVQALVAGVWAAGFSVLLLLILPGLVDAILFTGLAMLSAASLFFLTVPETYGWGSLSIVMALVVTALSERAPVAERWVLAASAGTLAFTVTNWMVGLIASFTALPWRRAVQVSINAFFVITVAWAVQKLFLFRSVEFFLGDRQELNFVLSDHAGGPMEILRSMLFHSVVMPGISVIDSHGRPEWPVLTIQHSTLGSAGPLAAIATVLWCAILALGTWATLRRGSLRRVRIVVVGSLAGQALLHLFYGEETFLYSLHFLPLLVVVAALGTRTRLRPVVLAAAVVLLPLLAISNARQLDAVTDRWDAWANPGADLDNIVTAAVDNIVTAAVYAAFHADPILRELDITLVAIGGVLYLKSDDTTKPQRDLAVKIAHEIDNVEFVVDLMR